MICNESSSAGGWELTLLSLSSTDWTGYSSQTWTQSGWSQSKDKTRKHFTLFEFTWIESLDLFFLNQHNRYSEALILPPCSMPSNLSWGSIFLILGSLFCVPEIS